MLKRRKCVCAGLSALPIFFVAMAVADGLFQHNYYLNIITGYVYMWVNMSFEALFQRLKYVTRTKLLIMYT